MNLYRFEDYKQVLKTKISEFKGHRGIVAKLAEAAGCQRSYLSQVLNSHVQLTPDHALGICQYLTFTEAETAFFLLLVDYARAGSRALKQRLLKQIKETQEKNSNLESKIETPIIHASESMYLYYSSWIWSALHIAVSIPELQTVPALAKHFQLPAHFIEQTLLGLKEMGLVNKSGEKWTYGTHEQHLSRRSSLISLHHRNWRDRAVTSSQTHPERNYHYTGISSASKEDFLKIYVLLVSTTEKIRKTISLSKEEELICLNIDFFKS
ncbi:MAG: TIGR02147 family protein [Pseudobdellovibrionaceae bacterium]